jgi:hypothetical protein
MSPSDPFNPDQLRIDGPALKQVEEARAQPQKLPRHRPGEWFLRGPVPWSWLEAAAGLPGCALAVGLCLWRRAKLRYGRRNGLAIKLCLSRVGLGVDEQAARRAVRHLEAAGLISVCRLPGRGLEVTLQDAPVAQPRSEGDPC